MLGYELTITTIAAVGSFLSGIIMLITFIQVITKLQLKDHVIYGDEATLQYEKLIKEYRLSNGYMSKPYEYQGGGIIVPKLQIQKFVYNPVIMDKELKKYKKTVIFIDEKRTVTTWYLKWGLNYSDYFLI